MRRISGKHRGRIALSNETLDVSGMVIGSLEVGSRGLLRLMGMVIGDIVARPGGVVQVRGMVNGSVQNLGGVVEIYGMINGKLVHRTGTTTCFKGAVADGATVLQDRTLGADIRQ